MLSRSFALVAFATAILSNLSQLAVASPEPIITPAPEFTRDATRVGEIEDREPAIRNNDLKARTPGEHLEERQDFISSCGYYYVDCGDGFCCAYGEVCYKSGATTKCRFAASGDFSIDISSILDSISSLMSGLPTGFDNYLTNLPTNSAGLSAYLASLTSAGIAAGKPTATSPRSGASSESSSNNGSTGLSGGAIGGIAAGGVIAIAAITGVIVFMLVRRSRKNHAAAAAAAAHSTPLQSQMTQPGYPPQTPGTQTPHTAYSQTAPPYPGVENGVFTQQQQTADNFYYKPPIPGIQEAEGDLKQQGIYVPPPVGHQGSQGMGPNPAHVQQQWQPVQNAGQAMAVNHAPAGSAPEQVVYEMEAGTAR